jgi:hypothetical protein
LAKFFFPMFFQSFLCVFRHVWEPTKNFKYVLRQRNFFYRSTKESLTYSIQNIIYLLGLGGVFPSCLDALSFASSCIFFHSLLGIEIIRSYLGFFQLNPILIFNIFQICTCLRVDIVFVEQITKHANQMVNNFSFNSFFWAFHHV